MEASTTTKTITADALVKRLNRRLPTDEFHQLIIKLRGWPVQLEGTYTFEGPDGEDPNKGVFICLDLNDGTFMILGLESLKLVAQDRDVLAADEEVTA